jgi:diaminopimelate epimerase
MQISVVYASGAGNTFTVVREGRRRFPPAVWRRLAPQLCQWTDGLLVIGKPGADGKVPVQYFNPDGSTGMLCGNGARCAAAIVMGEHRRSVTLLFAGQEIEAVATERGIRLRLAPPRVSPQQRVVALPEGQLTMWFADVGAPQAVIPVAELEAVGFRGTLAQVDMERIGRQIRHHTAFAPAGTNVSVYAVEADGRVWVRTYERGVERETQACGTAALAVALTAWVRDGVRAPVYVVPPSRSLLVVSWQGESPETVQALFLEGSVEVLGTDTLDVELEEEDEWS